jgi:RND family efflux transporter MFP subunit
VKTAVTGLIAAALSAQALWLGGCSKKEEPRAPPPQVSVSQALEREVAEWDEYTGRLEAVKAVEIRPRVAGAIERVAFREGAVVKKGDLLFQIDPRPYQAELDKAQAEAQRAVDRAALTKAEFERAQKLVEARAMSREEFDQRRTARAEAESAIRSANATVASVKLNLEFTQIRAPITGRISRALVTEGNLVTGGPIGGPTPTLLTTIVSVDPIYVYFEADERSFLKYVDLSRAGTLPSSRETRNPVQMGLANEEGHPHRGYIDFVENRLDASTGTIRGRAVFENKDGRFTPGLFARVRLIGSARYRATLVNDRAIGTDQGQKFVLVVDGGNAAQYRVIRLGPLIDGLRVVRDGIKPGETIVVNGMQRVQPGLIVTPQKVAMETLKPEMDDAGAPQTALHGVGGTSGRSAQ